MLFRSPGKKTFDPEFAGTHVLVGSHEFLSCFWFQSPDFCRGLGRPDQELFLEGLDCPVKRGIGDGQFDEVLLEGGQMVYLPVGPRFQHQFSRGERETPAF